jgi:hypothetical protein
MRRLLRPARVHGVSATAPLSRLSLVPRWRCCDVTSRTSRMSGHPRPGASEVARRVPSRRRLPTASTCACQFYARRLNASSGIIARASCGIGDRGEREDADSVVLGQSMTRRREPFHRWPVHARTDALVHRDRVASARAGPSSSSEFSADRRCHSQLAGTAPRHHQEALDHAPAEGPPFEERRPRFTRTRAAVRPSLLEGLTLATARMRQRTSALPSGS